MSSVPVTSQLLREKHTAFMTKIFLQSPLQSLLTRTEDFSLGLTCALKPFMTSVWIK